MNKILSLRFVAAVTVVYFLMAFIIIQFRAYEWVGLPQSGIVSEFLFGPNPILAKVCLVVGMMATPLMVAMWYGALLALVVKRFHRHDGCGKGENE